MLHNLSYLLVTALKAAPSYTVCPRAFGAMPGNIESLAYLLPKPHCSTWSIAGIGKSHVPMMLAVWRPAAQAFASVLRLPVS
jgi:hypothetical protein